MGYMTLAILGCIIAICIQYALGNFRQRRADAATAKNHGCRAPPNLLNQRPLGVDRLEQIFRANTESRLMELFLSHFRCWGTTLEHKFLGDRAMATIHPKNLKAILSTNTKDWSIGERRKVMFPLFGDGILTQDDITWKHSREMLRPQFTHKQYENLDIFREATDALIDIMPKKGKVDLQPLFLRLTLDVTTAFLFGESVNSLKAYESSSGTEFANAFNTAQDFIAKRMRLPGLYWLFGGSAFTKSCEDVHRFADQIIHRKLSRKPDTEKRGSRYVFLDSVAGKVQDRIALRSQIIHVLLAGRDATAYTLSWIVFLLIRHSRVMAILRAEIDSITNGSTVTSRRELDRMSYLQNVLRETLRLYPAVPVNSRKAVRTTILPVGGGPNLESPVLVPKGTVVAWSAYALHREPALYGMDAELFRPERWDERMPLHDDPINTKWGYLPFNGGPRICLGKDFAMTELAYVVVRLIQAFPTMGLPSNEKVKLVGAEKQTMTLVMSITDGCKVKLG